MRIAPLFFESDILPLQKLNGVYSKIKHHPLPFGLFSHHSIRGNSLQELNGVYSKCNFPLPHVFPLPPFPLKREPTASAPRGDTLSTRIDCYRSLFMSLVRGRKESKLVRSLVLFIKLGIRLTRRLAARVPSSKLHIPLISTP